MIINPSAVSYPSSETLSTEQEKKSTTEFWEEREEIVIESRDSWKNNFQGSVKQ